MKSPLGTGMCLRHPLLSADSRLDELRLICSLRLGDGLSVGELGGSLKHVGRVSLRWAARGRKAGPAVVTEARLSCEDKHDRCRIVGNSSRWLPSTGPARRTNTNRGKNTDLATVPGCSSGQGCS